MLDHDTYHRYKDLFSATGIPFVLTNRKGEEQAAFPETFEHIYLPDFAVYLFDTLSQRHPDGVIFYGAENLYYVVMTVLKEDLLFITSPISAAAKPRGLALPAVQKWITPEKLPAFYQSLAELPRLSTYQLYVYASLAKRLSLFRGAEGVVVHHLSGRITTDEDENESADARQHTEDDAYISDIQPESRARLPHISLHYEEDLMSCIQEGDRHRLKNILFRRVSGRSDIMSLNDLRQAKYDAIGWIRRFCRAAILGGVPAELCYELSDSSCQRVDMMNSLDEIADTKRRQAFEYCHLVTQYKGMREYSKPTYRCCDYIQNHLYQPITIEDLVATASLNRRSLSMGFKKETGMGIPEYITDARLREARYLLQSTDISLTEIGHLLQFCDQSYFCKKFKEKYGLTPRDYRTEPDKSQKIL